MLVAYFDESGIHDRSKVVSVAGLLGDTSEWARLEPAWKAHLSQSWLRPDLWFHAYECEEGVEQFDGLQRPIRDALVTGLTDVLLDRSMAFVGGSVFRKDWETCVPQAFRNRFPDPYHFCFEYAIQHLHRYVAHHFPRDYVAIVVAVPKDVDRKYVETIHGLYQESGAYPNLGSLSFARPQTVFPLQVADLVAFEHYQHLVARWTHGAGKFEPRPNFRRMVLSGLPVESGFHDCETLKGLVAKWPSLKVWANPRNAGNAPTSFASGSGAAGAMPSR